MAKVVIRQNQLKPDVAKVSPVSTVGSSFYTVVSAIGMALEDKLSPCKQAIRRFENNVSYIQRSLKDAIKIAIRDLASDSALGGSSTLAEKDQVPKYVRDEELLEKLAVNAVKGYFS